MSNPSTVSQKPPLPKLIIARFDETETWSDDITKKMEPSGSRAWGYYLVDLSMPFHQCSLQLDVQDHFLYNRLWNGKGERPFDEDTLTDLENYAGDDLHPTLKMTGDWGEVKVVDTDDYDEEDESWDEYVQRTVEYYRGNPVEFEFEETVRLII